MLITSSVWPRFSSVLRAAGGGHRESGVTFVLRASGRASGRGSGVHPSCTRHVRNRGDSGVDVPDEHITCALSSEQWIINLICDTTAIQALLSLEA